MDEMIKRYDMASASPDIRSGTLDTSSAIDNTTGQRINVVTPMTDSTGATYGAGTSQRYGNTPSTATAIDNTTNKPIGVAADPVVSAPKATAIDNTTGQPVETAAPTYGQPATTPTSGQTTTPAMPGATDDYQARLDSINRMYDAQRQSTLAGLQQAYDQSMAEQQAAAEQIAPKYQQALNDLAVQYERNRMNFNNSAAQNGFNSGAGAQSALSRAANYQRNYGDTRAAQATAEQAAARQQALTTSNYQNQIQSAVADNDYRRAAALLNEYNDDYKRKVDNAKLLAQYGDFSGYAQLYGDDAAQSMGILWAVQNPQAAYQMGAITADQFQNLQKGLPMNQGLDASGMRVGGSPTGGGNLQSLLAKLGLA